jgi:hypothetical protein
MTNYLRSSKPNNKKEYCAVKSRVTVVDGKIESKRIASADNALEWFPELEKFLQNFDIHEMRIELGDKSMVTFFIDRVYDTDEYDIVPSPSPVN